jgi:hypothetical protein
MNVLRKSYQTTYQKILIKINQKGELPRIGTRLIEKLSLCSEEKGELECILEQFLEKLL